MLNFFFHNRFNKQFDLQAVLEQFDNELSRKVNEVINEIRRQRCSYLRYALCLSALLKGFLCQMLMLLDWFAGCVYAEGVNHLVSLLTTLVMFPIAVYHGILLLTIQTFDSSAGDFFRSFLIEDKAPGGLSYVEFLVHVHRQIQSKMTWHAICLSHCFWLVDGLQTKKRSVSAQGYCEEA